MSNQIVITSGAKLRDLDDVIIGTDGILSSVAFNVANGVPRLDENGKILVSQLPNSVMEFKGVWNAATNTPTLANGTGNAGDVWLCNVAGTVDFGAGPIAFAVGDYAVYTGTVWARSSGATGTVTSVGVSRDGNALAITGSPVTTSGTINLGFSGDNTQYINGAGNLTTFPTLITSIGLTMPAAFNVSNSPLTANGTIGVTAAGYPSQYIRGDGTLADFPTSGGGGSSVSYYLNGGTSQGTIGGTTYYEMSKTADTGTGVDFSKSGDGFIVAFLTDAGDPSLLQIPAGNWNYEIYASMSSNGGTPEMYAELYVYDGTTFTLLSTSAHEILYDGVNLNLYTFAMAVPETVLTITDRLAIKLYATNSGGKTTTIHTQDSHLCQIITTFTTGLTALNGLTAQVQYFGTGTSGSDFNIVSSVDTHTFNLPTSSATKRGALSSTDWSTFNGKQDQLNGTGFVKATGTTIYYDNSTYALDADVVHLTGNETIGGTKTFSNATKNNGGILLQNGSSYSLSGYMNLGGMTNGLRFTSGLGISNYFALPSATGYTYTFPSASGTVALTSDIPSLTGYVPYTGATTNVDLGANNLSSYGVNIKGDGTNGGALNLKMYNSLTLGGVGYLSIYAQTDYYFALAWNFTSGIKQAIFTNASIPINTTRYYTLPNADGVLALTSDISYPVTSVFGRTGAVVATEGDYTLTQLGDVTITSPTTGQVLKYNGTAWINDTDANTGTVTSVAMTVPTGLSIAGSPITSSGTLAVTFAGGYSIPTNASQTTWDTAYTNRITSLTTTGTSGAATLISNVLNIPNYGSALSGYLPLTGGTLTGPLSISSTTNSMLNLINPTNGVNIDLVGFANSITYPQARIQLDDDGTYGGILRFFTKPTGSGTNALVQAFNIGSNQRVTFLSGVYISSGSLYLPASITSRTSQIEFANSASYTLLGMPNLTSTFYLRYGTDSIYFENDSGGVILTLNKTATAVFNSSVTASSLIKSGGTSSQFLKADGSVDSSTYLTTSSATSTYVPYTGATGSVNLGSNNLLLGSGNDGGHIDLVGNTTTAYMNVESSGAKINYNSPTITLTDKQFGGTFTLNLRPSLTTGNAFIQTFQPATGTIALTSDIPSLSGYLPLTGGTLTGPLTIDTTTNNQLNLVNSAGAINITLSGFGNGLTYPQARIRLDDSGNYGGLLKFYTKPSGAVTNALVLALTISDSQAATFTSSVQGGMLRAISGTGGIATGVGVEIGYESGGFGTILAYDRSVGLFKELRLNDTLYINGVNQTLSIGSATIGSGEKVRITNSGDNYFINMINNSSSLFSVTAQGTAVSGFGIMYVSKAGSDRIILNANGESQISAGSGFSSSGNYGLYVSNGFSPSSGTFNNGGTWAASNNYQAITWGSSSVTVNSGAVIAGFNAINRNIFNTAGVSVSVNQSTGIRAISAFQVLQQTGGTNAGTISHGASMFIQGIYPTNTSTTTFTNYYGLLINALDEWQGTLPYISITNRYGIYQAGASDKNYLASTLAIGNTSDAGYKLRIEGSNTIHLTASGGNPRIDFSSYGVSTSYPQARIMMPDAGYYGGYLDFYTKINGSSTNGLVLALRIKDDGALVKTDNAGGIVYAFSITPYGSGNALANKVSTTGGWDHFYFQNPNGNVGAISTSGSNTTYATSSDYRLKEDLQDFDALELLKSLKTYNFKWKNSSDRMFGLMAHELQSILPYAVVGKKDDIYADGSIKSQSVDYSLLGPILLKAIQQLETKIENLKTV